MPLGLSVRAHAGVHLLYPGGFFLFLLAMILRNRASLYSGSIPHSIRRRGTYDVGGGGGGYGLPAQFV